MTVQDKKELRDFTEGFSKEKRDDFYELLHDIQLYGGDINEAISEIEYFGKNPPEYVKGVAMNGFLGDLLAFADVGEDQSGSLVYKLITDMISNPEIAEKIFKDKEFSDKYQKTMQRAASHLSKREYFKNKEGKMEVFLKN